MKLYFYKIFGWLFGLAISGIILISCSDELGIKRGDLEGSSGVVLRLPNIESVSFPNVRASETSATSGLEGSLQELYLIIFQKNAIDKFEKISCQDLKTIPNTSGSVNSESYIDYPLTLEPGEYKFYLLANISEYINGGKKTIETLSTEEEIGELTLNFDGPLKAGHLPMACLSVVGESVNPETKSTITLTGKETSKLVYADLSFLCSKVRYTVLFDNTSANMSASFGDNVADFDDEVNISSIFSETLISESKTSDSDEDFISGSSSLLKYAYPYDSDYTTTTPITDFTNPKDTWGSGSPDNHKRAWQGVVYLPENINNNKTTLTFSGSCIRPTGETVYEISKDVPLCPTNDISEGKLKRGSMYDVVLTVKSYDDSHDSTDIETNVAVEDWTLMSLFYTLHGPYELEVDNTSIEVKSSKPGYLGYTSDITPEFIGFESPLIKYPGSQNPDGDPFYIIKVYKENNKYVLDEHGHYQIEVKVNSAIPYYILNQVEDENDPTFNKSDFMHFDIVAGKLHKMIEINSLDLEGFLTVSPKDLIIDVREYVTSGIDKGSVDLNISTNISGTLTVKASNKSIYNVSESNPFGIEAGIGTTITDDDSETQTITITKGEGVLTLIIEKLFEGIDYWNSNHGYTLEFTVEDGDFKKTEKVTITVKNYSTDYIIHFRCTDPTKVWEAPHIYVYQALSLPADLGTDNAGRTVGYREGLDKYAFFTALQYAFTNNITFKGWKGYGGPNRDVYDPEQDYTTNGTEGFVVFTNNNGWDYSPKSRLEDKFECVYDFSIDYNTHHTNRSLCELCQKNILLYDYDWGGINPDDNPNANDLSWKIEHSRLWPGIVMEKETGENEGWYKYVLTGVATPGKAMIMFGDGHADHEGKDNGHRYPADNQVGIPLFDFPNNEGWFEFDGNPDNRAQYFKNEKPTTVIEDLSEIKEDFWLRGGMNNWDTTDTQYKFEKNGKNQWIIENITIAADTQFKINSNGTGGWNDDYNFGGDVDPTPISFNSEFTLIQGGYAQNLKVTGKFTGNIILKYDGENTWTLILQTSEVIDPEPVAEGYRIYWPKNFGQGFYIFYDDDDYLIAWNDSQRVGLTDANYPGYYYYDIDDFKNSSFNYIFSNNPGTRSQCDDRKGVLVSNFGEALIDGGLKNVAYVKNGDLQLTQGLPPSPRKFSDNQNKYIRGSFYSDWATKTENQFYLVEGSDYYETAYIEISGGSIFKIADAGWGSFNFGGSGSVGFNQPKGLTYNGGNLSVDKDFKGYARIYYNGSSCTLTLIPFE